MGASWVGHGVLLGSVGSLSGGCWQGQSAILSNKSVTSQPQQIWTVYCDLGVTFLGLQGLVQRSWIALGCSLVVLGGSWRLVGRSWIQKRSWRFPAARGSRVGWAEFDATPPVRLSRSARPSPQGQFQGFKRPIRDSKDLYRGTGKGRRSRRSIARQHLFTPR